MYGIIYNSLADIERKLGINHSKVSMVCTGKRHTTGGLHWEFYKEIENGSTEK
jgi:hypothetical protein